MTSNKEHMRFSLNPLDLLRNPGVEKLIKEILDTYVPKGEFLLILPCSARKPYGTSPSQRLYWQAARQVIIEEGILERASLSGIYGIVPACFEDRVASYDFNLNRSRFTRGMHREIMELLVERICCFLTRYGSCFQAVISYGRERYWETMQMAAHRLQIDNLWVLPRKGASLRKEGLDELQKLLNRLTGK